MKRFSKVILRKYLESNINYYKKKYGFFRKLGYCQVAGMEISVVVAYGKYDTCCNILDDLNGGYITAIGDR